MIALLSHLINKKFEIKTGIKSLPLKPYERLDKPVSSHADMLLCVIDKNIFCYYDYYVENREVFEKIEALNYIINFVSNKCNKKYPDDVSLNVLIIGKRLFCNIKHTAKEIIDYAKNKGYKIINVNQGYSACSTLVLNEYNVITADKGMKLALEKEGIRVLLIKSEKIRLDGYDYGFIGGSGVRIEENIYFFGNIKSHPDYAAINKLLSELNLSYFEIIPDDVSDFGGVKLFF